jgi:hypothetical protein
MFIDIVLQVLRMIFWMLKYFQMTFPKFRKKLLHLLQLQQLKLLKLDPPTRLPLNSRRNLS